MTIYALSMLIFFTFLSEADKAYIVKQLGNVYKDTDLSKFIL